MPHEANPLLAAARVRTLCRQRALLILLTDLDDAGAASQLSRAVRLLTPKHVPVIASIANPELTELERAPATRWLDPYLSLAATEQLDRIRSNAFLLRQLGAPVVIAPAQHLEESVFALYTELKVRRKVSGRRLGGYGSCLKWGRHRRPVTRHIAISHQPQPMTRRLHIG